MGAIPAKLPGGYDLGDDEARARFETVVGARRSRRRQGCTCRRCSRPWRRARSRPSTASVKTRRSRRPTAKQAAVRRLGALDFLVVQDIFLTKDGPVGGRRAARDRRVARRLRAPPPTASGGCSGCARRSTPPGEAREGHRHPLRPRRAPRARLEVRRQPRPSSRAAVGVAGPLRDDVRTSGGAPGHPVALPRHRTAPEPTYLHGRLWASDPAERGRLAPFGTGEHEPPVDR